MSKYLENINQSTIITVFFFSATVSLQISYFRMHFARSIFNSYTESGRKQIHLYVFRGEICEIVTEFRPEISNSCSLFDSVRGHAFCKLWKCVKSLFEPEVPTLEVYHQIFDVVRQILN